MEWDGHTVITVNGHFLEVSVTRKTFSYMDALTIDDVFKTVVLATLKASGNSALRATYNKIIDDLDDDKTLTLASVQTTQIIPVGVIIIAIFSTHNRFLTLPFVTAQSGPRFIEISGRGNAFRVVS
jgi:hypothetical protein